jgi:hypothetical protein
VLALDRIKNYYRNTAIWLSPKAKWKSMALRACWNSIFRFPLDADLDHRMPVWEIGHHAIDVLGKYAGQCNVRYWWPVVFEQLSPERFFAPQYMKVPVESAAMLDEFILGGIFKAMLTVRDSESRWKKQLPDDKALGELAKSGGVLGLKALLEHVDSIQTTNKTIQSLLKEAIAKGQD